MKSTESFKLVISKKLEEMAATDPLFAASFKKENKNIDDCITYILNQVQKSGCAGFSDEEIFGMAAHYYDEENIEPGKPIGCNVVVNHSIELSAEEMQNAREAAKQKVMAEEMERLKKKSTPKKPDQRTEQPSLF